MPAKIRVWNEELTRRQVLLKAKRAHDRGHYRGSLRVLAQARMTAHDLIEAHQRKAR